ncbi:MAG: protein kinase [Actinomycetota bacterium]|nr:protein kinase [Actinomycetota bacterium]
MPEPTPTSTPTANGPLGPGARIAGRYRLVARVAQGGMAEVWEALDEVLTRPVAVKILLPHLAADKAFVARFRREAVSAARLSDPRIVSIYDTCSEGDVEAIVMELVRGTTLRHLLDDQGHLHPRSAIAIATQVADALDHAHGNGLVHRDVKPGNILLSDDGRVLVADFGIAKAAEGGADLTEVGQVVGTAKYLSPEQVEGGPIDARSDVYALGVVLYEMLCGRPPFEGDNATTTAIARLTSEPLRLRQVRAGIPRGLEDIVVRAMARRPGDRYSSAAALRSALEQVDLRKVEPLDDRTAAGIGGDATSWGSPDPWPSPEPRAERPERPDRRAEARPQGRDSASRRPPPRFAQSERPWLVPAALIVVIAATLGVVGVLLSRTEMGQGLFDAVDERRPGGSAERAVPITSTASFDPPPGSGEEHDDELAALLDDEPATAWTTEEYRSRDLGGIKPGVGVVLTLGEVAELNKIQVASPTQGWAASVYVADQPVPSLAQWGEAVSTEEGIDGDVTFDLGGATGGAVLLWITDLGDGSVGPRVSAAIGEVEVLA